MALDHWHRFCHIVVASNRFGKRKGWKIIERNIAWSRGIKSIYRLSNGMSNAYI